MSRSGYVDDCDDPLIFGRWRAQVASAMRGKRGQKLLRDALTALDALPEKKLIQNSLENEGGFCTLGAVGRMRGLDMSKISSHDSEKIADALDIANPLACEIMFYNDEYSCQRPWGKHTIYDHYNRENKTCFSFGETPSERWQRMRDWIVSKIKSKKGS